jgi:hypothetical protein
MLAGLVAREKARYELEQTLKRRLFSPQYVEEWGTDSLHEALARIVQQRNDEMQELVDEWMKICGRLNEDQTGKYLETLTKAIVYLEERGAKEPVWPHGNEIAQIAERSYRQ